MSSEATNNFGVSALRAFAQRVDRIVLVMQSDGFCTYASAKWTAFTGLDLGHSLGNLWQLAVHPNDLDAVVAELGVRTAGVPYEARGRLRSAHDEYAVFSVIFFPIREHDSALSEWIVFFDRVDLERAAEDRFRQLADALPLLVWTTDREDRLTFANRAWIEYTGLSIGSTLEERNALVHPQDLPALMSALRGNEPEVEFRLRRRYDGASRWHLLRWARFNSPNVPFYRIGTAMDVHDERATQEIREQEAEEQAFLAELGRAINSSLDLEQTLAQICRAAVPSLAQSCQLDLVSDGVLRTVAHAHEGVRREVPPARIRAQLGAPARATRFVERERMPLETVIAPLAVRGRVIGTLSFVRPEDSSVAPQRRIAFLEEVARRSALAVEHAQLYQHEHRVADALQAASLPRRLPHIDGIVMNAAYVPGQSEARIGGDWYDAFALADGRIVVSIGDVAGSGLDAAVTMSAVRQIIRGIAQVHADPVLMLNSADRALRMEEEDRFVTAFVGVIDPIANTMIYANAGHPPPFVRRAGGAVDELGFADLPLGVRDRPYHQACSVSVRDGDLLVLYTDGLVESQHDLDLGMRALQTVLADADIDGMTNPAAFLREYMLPDGAHDDVAILTLRIQRGGRAANVRRWSFASLDAPGLSRLRHEVRAVLISYGLSELKLEMAELVIGELAGNVVRHAPGAVEFVLDHTGSQVVLHVIDDGPGYERAPMLPIDVMSESGRGLFIVAQATREFSVTKRHPRGSHARAVLTR